MITDLSKLTMAKFIKLVNGDTSVLLRPHEVASPKKIAKAVRKLTFEFRSIADMSGVNAYISRSGDLVKLRCEELLYLICDALGAMNEIDKLRSVLTDAGMDLSDMTKEQILRSIKSELSMCRRKIKHIESEIEIMIPDVENGHTIDFDAITANLMSYFKFQIDINTMSASIYAHLLAQMGRELKAKTKALKKRINIH